MSRPSAATDFFIDVEGVGNFSFARRMMRDELRIAAEYSRLTEGVETPTEFLAIVGGWISALKVLTVSAPDGWNIDEMDPLDDDTYSALSRVHTALRDRERSFRDGKNKSGEAARAAAVDNAGVLVSAPLQPGADGPALS